MSLSFALLGLLNYSPMAGYDLKKVFDESINFFWAAHTSQIYRELKNLEQKGCVVSEISSSDKGPDKRIYSITDLGLSKFKEWINDVPDRINNDTRDEFLVRVFFSSHLGIDDLYFEMQKRLREYKKYYENLNNIENRMKEYSNLVGGEDIHYWKICLRRGYYEANANILWAEETIQYLEKLKENKKND